MSSHSKADHLEHLDVVLGHDDHAVLLEQGDRAAQRLEEPRRSRSRTRTSRMQVIALSSASASFGSTSLGEALVDLLHEVAQLDERLRSTSAGSWCTGTATC